MASAFDLRGLADAIGIVLLASGSFVGLSFHATHIGIHGADHSHAQEIIVGIVLMIMGVGILILNNRTGKKMKR